MWICHCYPTISQFLSIFNFLLAVNFIQLSSRQVQMLIVFLFRAHFPYLVVQIDSYSMFVAIPNNKFQLAFIPNMMWFGWLWIKMLGEQNVQFKGKKRLHDKCWMNSKRYNVLIMLITLRKFVRFSACQNVFDPKQRPSSQFREKVFAVMRLPFAYIAIEIL